MQKEGKGLFTLFDAQDSHLEYGDVELAEGRCLLGHILD